jgi:hypothetical protein
MPAIRPHIDIRGDTAALPIGSHKMISGTGTNVLFVADRHARRDAP